MSNDPWTEDGTALRLAVRLTPRARKDEVAGVVDSGDGRSALAIRLAAPPVEGAANKALIDYLAKRLGVPKSAVSIESGEKSRLKMLRIEGIGADALKVLL